MRYCNYKIELCMIDVDIISCIQEDLPQMLLLKNPRKSKLRTSKKYTPVEDIFNILN